MTDYGDYDSKGRFLNRQQINLSPEAPIAQDAYSDWVELGDRSRVSLDLVATSVSPGDSLDVTLQGSPDGTSASAYPIGTFDQVTDEGSQRKTFVVDRFVRAKYDITGSAGAASVTGTANIVDGTPTLPTTETLILSVDGEDPETVTFAAPADAAAVVTAINSALGAAIASLGGTDNKFLKLTSTTSGSDSEIAISASSTALTLLGLTAVTVTGTDLSIGCTLEGEAV